MRTVLILSFIQIFSFSLLWGQDHGKYDYHPPLKIPLILASNFGELRPNHFHMGLDFKTNGKIGYNLYSVEDGFVSRIKISPYGYGKVIYIDHPNGVTSVYAHCSEFKGRIDSLVKATQIKEQNFGVEIFPSPNELSVKRGEVIAISGNTGGSTAPHLHFELRDTKTEHALNPLVYGFDLPDTKQPEIRGVKVYSLSKDGYRYPQKSVRKTAQKSGSHYTVEGNSITIPSDFITTSGGLGLAFDVIDRLDGANNQCGLYGSFLIVNGDTLFGQQTDRIPFESTRYVNCHKDYEEYAQNRRKFHKSFKTKENDLPIYTIDGLGLLKAQGGKKYSIRYVAFDTKGNTSTLQFNLQVNDGEMGPNEPHLSQFNYLLPDQSMMVKSNDTKVEFGINTVYEPLYIDDKVITSNIGEPNIPVHKAYKITLPRPEGEQENHYLEITTAKGKRRALSLDYHEDHVVCSSKYFGRYQIKEDRSLPTITPSGFSQSSTIYTKPQMKWRISDTGSGLKDYDLFINGEWYLVEYEYKNATITFTRPENFLGRKEIKLIVTDSCGNESVWETSIEFK